MKVPAPLPPLSCWNRGGVNEPVDVEPTVLRAPVLIRFNPQSNDAPRSTSAKRTFIRICGSTGGTVIFSRFTGLPSSLAIASARPAEV